MLWIDESLTDVCDVMWCDMIWYEIWPIDYKNWTFISIVTMSWMLKSRYEGDMRMIWIVANTWLQMQEEIMKSCLRLQLVLWCSQQLERDWWLFHSSGLTSTNFVQRLLPIRVWYLLRTRLWCPVWIQLCHLLPFTQLLRMREWHVLRWQPLCLIYNLWPVSETLCENDITWYCIRWYDMTV